MRKPKQRQTIENMELLLGERRLILYGKGGSASDLVKRYDVAYIVDKNDELWGTYVENAEICSPDRLYREQTNEVVILVTAASQNVFDITKLIWEIDDFDIFYWNVLNNSFLNTISVHLYDNYARIRAVEDKLYDDRSRKILREIIHRRVIGCSLGYGDLKEIDENQYIFDSVLYAQNDGVILDCGGYTGDTAELFVRYLGNAVKKMYTFEALPANIESIKEKKATLAKDWDGDLYIIPYAVSNEKKRIPFWETIKKGGCFSPAFDGNTKYRFVDPVNVFDVATCIIDEVVPPQEKVRLIKMDIEGAEYEALCGAEKTIE